ncbi:MAG: phosphatidate cytidylyltransferase [Planctomycetaceae bacterium]|nr:phosphatidate cytidylyltransferase [Planctomycetaceae bacterium]
MLRWRVLISLILIPLLAGIFYVDARGGPSAIGLFLLCCGLACRSVWELVDLLRDQQPGLNQPLLMSGAVALMYAAWWPHLVDPVAMQNSTNLTGLSGMVAVVTMLLLAVGCRRFREPGGHVPLIGTELLILIYSGVLLGVTAQLRWVAGLSGGYLALGSLLICTKGSDVGAYFAGRLLGKAKLAPILSPKKTIAGAIGGVIAALLLGMLWFHFAAPWFTGTQSRPPLWAVLVYSGGLAIAGMVGDLSESLIKRDVGKKDSAPLLPGFGGALDLLDSVLFAGPVAYLLWLALPLAPWMD